MTHFGTKDRLVIEELDFPKSMLLMYDAKPLCVQYPPGLCTEPSRML